MRGRGGRGRETMTYRERRGKDADTQIHNKETQGNSKGKCQINKEKDRQTEKKGESERENIREVSRLTERQRVRERGT